MRTHEQQTAPTHPSDGPTAHRKEAGGDRPDARAGRFFGYPDAALAGTWTVRDLQAFLRVSERKARELMRADGAPPPLRLGSERCDRWNPYEVVAWLHGCPEAASGPSNRSASPTEAVQELPRAAAAPGRQWSPRPAPGGRAPGRASAARR